jgi:hypothetical protein
MLGREGRVLRTSRNNLVAAIPRPNVKAPLTQYATSLRQPEANADELS